MPGEILLKQINGAELNVLMASGATLSDSIFHSDRNNAGAYGIFEGRLANPVLPQNRAGIPPHIYINLPAGFRANNAALYRSILSRTTCPPSIVTFRQALAGWAGMTPHARADAIELESRAGLLRFEVYFFAKGGSDLFKVVLDSRGTINSDLLEFYHGGSPALVPE